MSRENKKYLGWKMLSLIPKHIRVGWKDYQWVNTMHDWRKTYEPNYDYMEEYKKIQNARYCSAEMYLSVMYDYGEIARNVDRFKSHKEVLDFMEDLAADINYEYDMMRELKKQVA